VIISSLYQAAGTVRLGQEGQTMTYRTKSEAEIAARSVPSGYAMWIGPAFVKAYGVTNPGWYVVALGKAK
jgi:hypothetical protein